MGAPGTATLTPARRPAGGRAFALDPWRLTVLALAALLALPVVTVAAHVFHPAGEVWRHLVATVLAEYVRNSLLLAAGVGAGTLVIGVGTAWLTTLCRFPGRRLFEWALLLPLAVPAYIIAYTYTGMLDFAGPVQSALREAFGWRHGDYWFPEIRSLGGAVAMLTLVLYPYVYLLARAAFLEQSVAALEAARILGCGPWGAFLRVAVPAARPAIVAGVSLVLMETLADFGTVQYFGVSTFTTGIYRTWFGLGDSAAAAQLAAVLLGFVFAVLVLERRARRRARFHHVAGSGRPLPVVRLRGVRGWLAAAACALPLLLGFALPFLQLAAWTVQTAESAFDPRFLRLVVNTLNLAGGTAVLALVVALVMAYGRRLRGGAAVAAAVRVAATGYAVPGTVIAVGVLIPFGALDNALDAWMRAHLGVSTGLLLSGTVAGLVFAYLVRFLAVSLNTVESGLARIRPAMDEAARTLGHAPREILRRVHLPMLRGSLLTAVLLVFVDVMKELPATLILRPFNFNTLAVRAYELASDERLMDAAAPAVTIVLAGIVPVLLLSRAIARSRRREVEAAELGTL
ncbi:ABC transporter permease [Inmirania thermothiophila]|uniref:Iron(III) transport system permease protein n=1 Tax=Inmirania thermothiophila TaxID=1750597 RepID=A0A3N1YB67_9GAMM|nr:iron(III) transport system permease protein [Inmirania thermothiophila]